MDSAIQPIDRVAFYLGPQPVYWYGVIIGLGIVLGFLLATRECKRRGVDPDTFADLLIFAIPIAIISARIYYVIFEWDSYKDNFADVFKIWEGGIAIHGGLIGAVVTAIVFTRIKGISFWKIADIAAPSIILGQAIGRWGNFINQEAHGGEVTRSFLEGLFLPDWIINQMYINGTYYHPTFLYESLWNFSGLALLLFLRRVNLRRGELFLSYVIWYSIGRFFIEGMRTDSLLIMDFLRTAQLISVLLIAGALAIGLYRRKTGMAKERYLDA